MPGKKPIEKRAPRRLWIVYSTETGGVTQTFVGPKKPAKDSAREKGAGFKLAGPYDLGERVGNE